MTNTADRITKLQAMANDPHLTSEARAAYQAKADYLRANLNARQDLPLDFLPVTYDELVDSMGYRTLAWHSDGLGEVDHWVVVRDGRRHGYLELRQGCCSDCDPLEACTSLEAVRGVRESYRDDIEWFDNLGALQAAMAGRTWAYQNEAVAPFLRQVAALAPDAIPA